MPTLYQRIVNAALGGGSVNASAEELSHELEAMADDERDAIQAAVLRLAAERIRAANRFCEWISGVEVNGIPVTQEPWFTTGERLLKAAKVGE